jgi:4-amino-4-deoxy-L-arabinose transferase-like glycosyltransferase
LLIVLVFTFSGLTGHDPWKADEAYVFGVVQHMLQSSDWIVPTLAGEPFMEKPPLYYWTATAFSRALSGWLPAHDGARLASGFFMLLTFWALRSTALIWWGRNAGNYVILVLIGCLGTLVQSHMMMPDIASLTSFSFSALGFATILSRPAKGGILIGLGVGIGFLSKGLLAPGVMVITALALPLLFKEWRTRSYRHGLTIAAVVAAPWCAIRPISLYLRSPPLFTEWFWANNIGRFFGFSVERLRTEHLPWFWTKTIPWFTFPGLPLALWALWCKRCTAFIESPIQYSLVAFSVLMLVLAVSSSGRCVYAWPLMIPIAILAAPGITSLPAKVERLSRWGELRAVWIPLRCNLDWLGDHDAERCSAAMAALVTPFAR